LSHHLDQGDRRRAETLRLNAAITLSAPLDCSPLTRALRRSLLPARIRRSVNDQVNEGETLSTCPTIGRLRWLD
ncbi:hypothetical protein, partial [Amycolatopsis sp.]|uniref:hypothetical protein n=1 Tax=Amycolatopsis sp. TaxID=37632 RepID=UPI002C46C63A